MHKLSVSFLEIARIISLLHALLKKDKAVQSAKISHVTSQIVILESWELFPEVGEGVVLEVAERCLDDLEGVQVIHNLLLGSLTHEDSIHGLLDHS